MTKPISEKVLDLDYECSTQLMVIHEECEILEIMLEMAVISIVARSSKTAARNLVLEQTITKDLRANAKRFIKERAENE